jgi:chromosome segregation ATPase
MNEKREITIPSQAFFKAFRVILICILFECIISGQPLAFDKIIRYRIGSIDSRFALSSQEISDAVHQAVSLWENAVGHKIFKEDPHGEIKIDFIYDKRQAVTDDLKKISYDIDEAKFSYDELMSRYEDLKWKVEQKKDSYTLEFNSYMIAYNTYQAEIDAAAKKDLVSRDESLQFEEKKHDLESQLSALQVISSDLQQTVDDLNKMAVDISEIISSHNTQVLKYNNARNNFSGEFDAGRYEITNFGEKSITIYHIKDKDKLVRALAHEFGHAQGLKHSRNPDSIMYYLNRSDSIKLLPEDILAMQARCSNN